MSDPCYWHIDHAIVTTQIDTIHQMYIHVCNRCGHELFRTGRLERAGRTAESVFERAREEMKKHLGYAPSNHLEAMGL